MLDAKELEALAEKLSRLVPPGLRGVKSEFEENVRAVLRSQFERLDLVSRERFDAQAELLARLRTRLTKLERRLSVLEDGDGAVSPRKSARSTTD